MTNNKEARLTNGAYTYDNVGLRFVGTVDNHYGIILNYSTLSNQSTIDNNWGKIFNNCDGTLLGIGPVLGNDPNEVDCSSVNEQVQGQNWI